MAVTSEQKLRTALLLFLMGMLVCAASCSSHRIQSPIAAPSTATPQAHWSARPLAPDHSVTQIEVAGSHTEIGRLLGHWYRDQGCLSRRLTAGEQQTARALLAFYGDVAPNRLQQLRGLYAAFDLNLDDASDGIHVWDEEGIRILLPGLAERHSCSVIATRPEMATDGHGRLGRNHDWPAALTDVLLVFTAPETGHPTVVMTRRMPGFAASDGMNAAGLASGLASVRNVGYASPAGPALVSTAAYRLVLEQCANVAEAVAMLRRLPVAFINASPDELVSHILLADRSGASAVVEFLPEGIVASQTDTPYQVMTNSHWAGPADQPSCPRYNAAAAGLEGVRGALDEAPMMKIIRSIHGSTQWTIVYDLQDLSLQLSLPGDGFSHVYEFSLADMLARLGAQ